MATARTEITELVTGLAMLGYGSLDHAMTVRPSVLANVQAEHFERLASAWKSGKYRREFEMAWANGEVFARSVDGLRGRPPWRVEWKGPHKPPGYEQIPADLRVDHVYLVSCKYGSTILHNAAPGYVFDRRLADRRGERVDWFHHIAPEAYQELYDACRAEVGDPSLPELVTDLQTEHRSVFKAMPRQWRSATVEPHRAFVQAVSVTTSQRWNASMNGSSEREEFLWRLLRLQPAPYFVLGSTSKSEPLRYRVLTPWDFRDRFRFETFDTWPQVIGQPVVSWRAVVRDRQSGRERVTDGHVEIRWSHGRFSGAPEAKVHLDSHPHDVAGYEPLE